MSQIKLSIIIPCHNEEDNIEKLVRSFLKSYSKHILEIIIVNDGSKDKTAEIANKLVAKLNKVRVIHRIPPNGVGLAIKEGVMNTNPEATHILTLDADFIENVKDIKYFLEKIDKFDGLVGSRYLKPNYLIRYPRDKKLANRTFHKLCEWFLGIHQKDLTNNFKFYKREVFFTIPLTQRNFSINAETGIYPIVYGYHIGEVPVKWIGRTASMGMSKFNLFKVGPAYLKILVKGFAIKYLVRPRLYIKPVLQNK